MEKTKEKNGKPTSTSKFIIPPGLINKLLEFEAHYHICKGKPIIIVGPTGVGKTLFLQVFEKLFQEEHGKKVPIQRINCSHYDDRLVRSELFGHMRGSFTDAIKEKEGLIKKADGGVLFLEEIGELPRDIQAKLLTVIEDGLFYRVGGTEEEKVSVQIVGTTNNVRNFREDFWQRFMPFYVPPLHERREDALYYLYDEFPELIKTLNPQEVLWLLTYNWPGNVRELKRIARLLDRNQKILNKEIQGKTFLSKAAALVISVMKDDGRLPKSEVARLKSLKDRKTEDSSKEFEGSVEKGSPRFLLAEDQEEFFFAVQSRGQMGQELTQKGIDIALLDEILKRFRVGLETNQDLAFPELSENSGEFFKKQPTPRYDPRFDVKQYIRIPILEEAKTGLDIFCSLFFQGADSNKNLLGGKQGTTTESGFESGAFPRSWREAYVKLARSIFEYLSGVQLPRGAWIPEETDQRQRFFADLADRFPSNPFLTSILGREPTALNEQAAPDIWRMNHDELLRFYYEGMVKRSGGVQEHAAKRMGVNYRTFRSRCKSLGVKFNTK